MMLNKKERYFSSLSGGIIMFLAFPFTGSLTPLIFIGLLPLLIIEDSVLKSKLSSSNLFLHTFLCFLIFNIIPMLNSSIKRKEEWRENHNPYRQKSSKGILFTSPGSICQEAKYINNNHP